jgi:hypothetical protein
MKQLWRNKVHHHLLRWQDGVFSIGQLVFLMGLMPSVLGSDKPAAFTSITTAVMLCAFLVVYASYRLWATFIFTAVTISVWFLLAAQVIFA